MGHEVGPEHPGESLVRIVSDDEVEGYKQLFEPTVLAGCSHETRVMNEEIFGPVVSMIRAKDLDEVIRISGGLVDEVPGSGSLTQSRALEQVAEPVG